MVPLRDEKPNARPHKRPLVEYFGIAISSVATLALIVMQLFSLYATQTGWDDILNRLAEEQSKDARSVYSQLSGLDEVDLRLIALEESAPCLLVRCGSVSPERAKAMAVDAVAYRQSVDAKWGALQATIVAALALLVSIYSLFHEWIFDWLRRQRGKRAPSAGS